MSPLLQSSRLYHQGAASGAAFKAGTQVWPYAPWTPNSIPGLTAWVDASQDSYAEGTNVVTGLPDHSPAHRTFTTTGGFGPLYRASVRGKPSYEWVTSPGAYGLDAGPWNPGTAGLTFFFVGKIAGGSYPMMVVWGPDPDGYEMRHDGATLQAVLRYTTHGVYFSHTTADHATNDTIHALRSRGPFGSDSYVNGVKVTGGGVTMPNENRTLYIGRREGGYAYFGTMREVLVYAGPLSDADMDTVHAYLTEKWSLSPPVFDPATLSGSVLALNASDVLAGTVTTWLDRSPAANHLTVMSGSPVAASGYVTFTTANVMASTNPVNVVGATPRHLFMKIRSRWVNGAFMGYGSSGNANLFDLWYFTGQGSLIWHGYGGGNDTVAGAPAMSPDVWHLVELSYDGSTIRVSLDEGALQVTGVGSLLTTASPFLFGIGRYSPAGDFDMKAFYFYDRKLSDVERAQVLTHLRDK